jgi:hypothetical protein
MFPVQKRDRINVTIIGHYEKILIINIWHYIC